LASDSLQISTFVEFDCYEMTEGDLRRAVRNEMRRFRVKEARGAKLKIHVRLGCLELSSWHVVYDLDVYFYRRFKWDSKTILIGSDVDNLMLGDYGTLVEINGFDQKEKLGAPVRESVHNALTDYLETNERK